jgi:hypothetical protein
MPSPDLQDALATAFYISLPSPLHARITFTAEHSEPCPEGIASQCCVNIALYYLLVIAMGVRSQLLKWNALHTKCKPFSVHFKEIHNA